MSGLKNDFPPSVKRFWQYEHPYSYCGRNGIVDLHHIKKRISNSIFNSIPITREEHGRGARHYPKQEKYYIQWTISFIQRVLSENPTAYTMRRADVEYLTACLSHQIITMEQFNFFININTDQNG